MRRGRGSRARTDRQHARRRVPRTRGDFPDAAIELPACDQMRSPVRLHESRADHQSSARHGAASRARWISMALSNVSLPAAAWNGRAKKAGRILPQRAVAREHGIEVTTLFPASLMRPARDGSLHQCWRTSASRKVSSVCAPSAATNSSMAPSTRCIPSRARRRELLRWSSTEPRARRIHADEELIVHLNNLVDQRFAGLEAR